MIYNFSARFAAAVEHGTKLQTIRAQRKDGKTPKVGERLFLYTGLRSKGVRKLREANCTDVEPITMQLHLFFSVRLRDRLLTRDELDVLAHIDGFASAKEFIEFFCREHGIGPYTPPFVGHLIRWTPLSPSVERPSRTVIDPRSPWPFQKVSP